MPAERLWSQLTFARGVNGDAQRALLAFFENRPGSGVRFARGIGPRNGDWSGPLNLEPIVESAVGVEALHAEAGAGVIDLDEPQSGGAVVLESGLDVGRAARRNAEDREQHKKDRRSSQHQNGSIVLRPFVHSTVLRSRMRAESTTPVARVCMVIGKASTFQTHSSPLRGRLSRPRYVRSR